MSKNKAKLKAKLLDLARPLLQQLKEVENGYPNEMKPTIAKIVGNIRALENCIVEREKWETQLIGCIEQIRRQVDRWTSESDENQKEQIKKEIIEQDIQLEKLLKVANVEASKEDEANNEANGKDTVDASSNTGKSKDDRRSSHLKELNAYMMDLNPQLRDCIYSLGFFPVRKLNKRQLIYWWIGLGLVPLRENKHRTAEQYAEIIFEELIDRGILIPDETNKLLHNHGVKWWTIQTTIQEQFIYAFKRKGLFRFEERKEGTICFHTDGQAINNNIAIALLNCEQNYLDSEDMEKVLTDNPDLQVLQFGWWHRRSDGVEKIGALESKDQSEGVEKIGTLKSMDCIVVDEVEFLNKVGKNVIYLSLRGISRIDEIPQNIGKLEGLMILDLRSCHTLEKLPEKPRSKLRGIMKAILPEVVKSKLSKTKWFKNLTHLDMSECYLLDHMPKWLCELSNLEVLKGFVVRGVAGNKDQFCQIDDLSKLKKLRKLSIKIAKLSKDSMDLKCLEKFAMLSVLTITWKLDKQSKPGTISSPENLEKSKPGTISSPKDLEKSKPGTISFPKNLEKLDIRCYPNAEATKMFAELKKLKKMKRLYVRGGKLTKLIDPDPNPNLNMLTVELLRLRCLQHLQLSFTDLKNICTSLKCVEYYQCPKLEGFPEKGTSCYISEPEPQPEGGHELLADSMKAHQSQSQSQSQSQAAD